MRNVWIIGAAALALGAAGCGSQSSPSAVQDVPVAASTTASEMSQTVDVAANKPSIGVMDVAHGDDLVIDATGSASFGYQGAIHQDDNRAGESSVDPSGTTSVGGQEVPYKVDESAVLPSAPVGALIARIGDGRWFEVDSSWQGLARASGMLSFAFNDETDSYADNTGSYTVTVKDAGPTAGTANSPPPFVYAPPVSSPTPAETEPSLDGSAERTSCEDFSRLDDDQQASVVEQMLEEMNQTGWGVDEVLPNVRAMCNVYPPDTPISVTMTG
jgi:hypothetical protein